MALDATLGSFIAGPQALKRLASNAPRNTDDHPVVAYREPRITCAPDSLPRDRLLALRWAHTKGHLSGLFQQKRDA